MKRLAPVEGLDPVVIGTDGFATLALSCGLVLLSFGASLLAALSWVTVMAWRAECEATGRRRILVLGMQLGADGRPRRAHRERLDRAFALWSRARNCEIVLLGGRTVPGLPSEA